MKCPNCNCDLRVSGTSVRRIHWSERITIGWIFGGALFLILLILAFIYRGHISWLFGLLEDGVGGKKLAWLTIVVGVFVLVNLLLWLCLPLIILIGVWRLRPAPSATGFVGSGNDGAAMKRAGSENELGSTTESKS